MKKLLLAGVALATISASASAADLPRSYKAPAPAPAPFAQPYFSWTGGWIGVSGGYALSDNERISPAGGSAVNTGLRPEGGFFGGEIGYNYQFAPNWVVGISGDAFLSDINDSKTLVSFGGVNIGASSKLDKFGTVRGKLGYAIDRVMVYGTGGLAVGYNEGTIFANTALGNARLFDSQTHIGWAAGAGIDWAFTQNMAWKTEYLYMDLGSKRYFNDILPVDVHPTFHVIKSGIDFKFSAY